MTMKHPRYGEMSPEEMYGKSSLRTVVLWIIILGIVGSAMYFGWNNSPPHTTPAPATTSQPAH